MGSLTDNDEVSKLQSTLSKLSQLCGSAVQSSANSVSAADLLALVKDANNLVDSLPGVEKTKAAQLAELSQLDRQNREAGQELARSVREAEEFARSQAER